MTDTHIDPASEITHKDPAVLKPLPSNARVHSDEQVEFIASRITEMGFTAPVLIDEQDMIIAGHGRVLAALHIKRDTIPCVVAVGWPDEKKRKHAIEDNIAYEQGDWDAVLFANEFYFLQDTDYALDPDDLDMDFDYLPDEEVDEEEDEVPEILAEPISKLGDIWILGEHRVMCGNSTSMDDCTSLMDGVKSNLVFTDPPYNVDYSGLGQNNLGKIKSDKMSDEDFEMFCRSFFSCFSSHMENLACIYVCHPDSQSAPKMAFEKTFSEFFKKSSTIIWVKQSAGMGWQDYRAQHEPILYGWKKGNGSHYYCGDRSKTTVWDISRDAQSSYVHPTQNL